MWEPYVDSPTWWRALGFRHCDHGTGEADRTLAIYMLDRGTILLHLAESRQHVADAVRLVLHEREIIAEKERCGLDTAGPR